MNLNSVKTLLLDGDGVLWHGDRPAPGLNRFFDQLNARQIRWGLLTNNATRGADDLVEKFRGFGVEADPGVIFTSALATASYLGHKISPGATVYIIGEDGLQEALTSSGYVVDTSLDETVSPGAVIVSLDRSFSYEKLKKAMRLIREGAVFIATNPDTTFPGPHGLSPGAGSLVAAVAAASGVKPVVMGKPGSPLFDVAMDRLGASADTTAMIGDRLDTDILGARQLGLSTVLVLSGVSRREEIDRLGIYPDMVYEDIAALADALESQTDGDPVRHPIA
jgi:4-nitrophenyl phosphatase